MESNNENSHSSTFSQGDNGNQQIGNQTFIIHHPPSSAPEIKKVPLKGTREIDYDLKAVIDDIKQPTSPPTKATIDFRDEERRRVLRDVVEIPVKHLRFRKNNGRIIADVESYEFEHKCKLDERTEKTQKILHDFLLSNDKERNEELKTLLEANGQRDPAIATCDGFLINGNRRKMAFEELYRLKNQDSAFESMRVVLLPENVTELEIQQIENRCQTQSEGKAEYKGLSRALMYRRNILNDFPLKAQLKDDPNYRKLSDERLQKEVEKYEANYILPLECVDRYLKMLDREGRYNSITEGANDRQGRWHSFIEYSKLRNGPLSNKEEMAALGIGKRQKDRLEMALFRVIRKRGLPAESHETQVGQLYRFIRDIPKYLRSPEATAEIMAIAKINNDLPEAEKYDVDGQLLSDRELDLKWGRKYGPEILGKLQQARLHLNNKQMGAQPKSLLADTARKLNYASLGVRNMSADHYREALELVREIRAYAWKISETIEDMINQQQYIENKEDTAAQGSQNN